MSLEQPSPESEIQDEAETVEENSTEPQPEETAEAAQDAEETSDGEEGQAPQAPTKRPEDPRDRRIRELSGIIEEKDELLRDYIRAHKQAQAQWEAYKQRLERDRLAEVEAATAKVIEKFLAVSDNMERSIQAGRGTDSVPALLEGMELVYKGFVQVMAELGLTRVDPTGQAFDPSSMEALGIVPVSEGSQDNIVVNCLQPGFALGQREIRPALVQVGKFTG